MVPCGPDCRNRQLDYPAGSVVAAGLRSLLSWRVVVGRQVIPGDVGSSPSQQLAEASASAMLAADRASQGLGMILVEVSPGSARLRMAITEAMVNGHGICHGGFIFCLGDSAFAVACNTYGEATVAAGAAIDFLEPVRQGDMLEAEAQERIRRSRSGIYDVTVRRLPDRTVVAEFRGRSKTLPAREPDGRPDQGRARSGGL